MDDDSTAGDEKPSTTKPGIVQKIIKPAEELYREIRIENTLQDEEGQDVALKPGAPVDVTIEADKKDTIKKAG